jgi:Flp pilus assembly protein TadG
MWDVWESSAVLGLGVQTVRVVGARTGRILARLARRRRRDERGSALVEAAIILPVIILLTFGAIDFGIGFNQKAGLDNAGRAGVRLAATDTFTDNATNTVTGSGTILAHTQIGFDAASSVNAALSQIESKPALVHMYVFRSAYNGTTWAPASVTTPGACSSNCIMYNPQAANSGQFDLYNTTGTWPATAPLYPERNACPPVVNTDRVGITIVASYRFLTGLIGTTITLTSTSAAQLEPTNC